MTLLELEMIISLLIILQTQQFAAVVAAGNSLEQVIRSLGQVQDSQRFSSTIFLHHGRILGKMEFSTPIFCTLDIM